MSLRIFLWVAWLGGIAAGSVEAAAERPNVLFILADDLGYDSVGCYGSTSYATPNMDRLAAEGMRFTHAYATPLCTNTRIQLMSGKYNNRNWKAFGIFNPKDKTFGHYLQESGYVTAMAGKWQLFSYDPPDWPGAQKRRSTGMRAEDAGFDRYSLWHTGHTEDKGSRYADPVIYEDGAFREDTRGRYGPDLWVEYLGDFMAEAKSGDQPFFAYYSMALPHNPFEPTPDSPEWQDPERRRVEETRFYKDMVEYADQLLGRLMAKLEELGLRDDTLLVFYSDNGTNAKVVSRMGDQIVHGGKGTPADLGTRVPLIVSWKGRTPEGVVCEDLIDSTDFLPTFLDAAGRAEVAKAEGMDGRSFLAQIEGQEGDSRDWVYVHQDPRPGWDKDAYPLVRFARDQRFKLYGDGRLFDVPNDLYEEKPILPEDGEGEIGAVRWRLQEVLDSMKPYPIYDPMAMPRSNFEMEVFEKHSFQDLTGHVVMEAETVPLVQDESWRMENKIPGFTGRGYLRALRDQQDEPGKGIIAFDANLQTAGEWTVLVRHRHDHADPQKPAGFWMRIDGGDWVPCQSLAAESRGWEWGYGDVGNDVARPLTMTFGEGIHRIELAPMHDSLKVDRVVLSRAHRMDRARDVSTPEAAFHPWVNKYLK